MQTEPTQQPDQGAIGNRVDISIDNGPPAPGTIVDRRLNPDGSTTIAIQIPDRYENKQIDAFHFRPITIPGPLLKLRFFPAARRA